jgi:hypothetical protein
VIHLSGDPILGWPLALQAYFRPGPNVITKLGSKFTNACNKLVFVPDRTFQLSLMLVGKACHEQTLQLITNIGKLQT